jgi:TetR/AcrR family transcriptional regulator, cholesterol catabolism regulator
MAIKAVRKRLDPAKRSELILEKALQLFAVSHYSIVTVRDIALHCGINVGLIYHYFDSKDHLFRSALTHALEQLIEGYEQRRSNKNDPIAEITAWLDTHAAIAPMLMRMVKIMADYAAMQERDPAADAILSGFYRRERELLEDTLRRGVEARVFRAVDVEKAARIIGRQLDGIFYASASRGDNRIAQDIEELEEFIWHYLGEPSGYSKPRDRRRDA